MGITRQPKKLASRLENGELYTCGERWRHPIEHAGVNDTAYRTIAMDACYADGTGQAIRGSDVTGGCLRIWQSHSYLAKNEILRVVILTSGAKSIKKVSDCLCLRLRDR